MHSAASLELPKLPDDIDGWKLKLPLHDVDGWIHSSKNNKRPLILPWLDDFTTADCKANISLHEHRRLLLKQEKQTCDTIYWPFLATNEAGGEVPYMCLVLTIEVYGTR